MKTFEIQQFIKKCIKEQGNQSAIHLFKIVKWLSYHVPHVIHLTGDKQEEANKIIYTLAESQDEIDAIIDSIVESEEANVCITYDGFTIHFNHIEAITDIIICYLISEDRHYELILSKEPGQSNLLVTKADTQKHWIGTEAEYDKIQTKDENTIYLITKV